MVEQVLGAGEKDDLQPHISPAVTRPSPDKVLFGYYWMEVESRY
jgi:hypothetical protein